MIKLSVLPSGANGFNVRFYARIDRQVRQWHNAYDFVWQHLFLASVHRVAKSRPGAANIAAQFHQLILLAYPL